MKPNKQVHLECDETLISQEPSENDRVHSLLLNVVPPIEEFPRLVPPVEGFPHLVPPPSQGHGFPHLVPPPTQGHGFPHLVPPPTQGHGFPHLVPPSSQGHGFTHLVPPLTQGHGFLHLVPPPTQGHGFSCKLPPIETFLHCHSPHVQPSDKESQVSNALTGFPSVDDPWASTFFEVPCTLSSNIPHLLTSMDLPRIVPSDVQPVASNSDLPRASASASDLPKASASDQAQSVAPDLICTVTPTDRGRKRKRGLPMSQDEYTQYRQRRNVTCKQRRQNLSTEELNRIRVRNSENERQRINNMTAEQRALFRNRRSQQQQTVRSHLIQEQRDQQEHDEHDEHDEPMETDQTRNEKRECLKNFDPLAGKLEDQQWARIKMREYSTFCGTLEQQCCSVCSETWPTHTKVVLNRPYICDRCKKNKTKFCKENLPCPAEVPEELKHLTMVEKLLIARATPIMKIYYRPGGQRAYKGHCISISQKVSQIATILPQLPEQLEIIVVRKQGENGSHKDFRVRRQKVQNALEYLKQHNPYYSNITIDQARLQALPADGPSQSIQEVQTTESTTPNEEEVLSDDASNDIEIPDNVENDMQHSFISSPVNVQQEEEAITEAVAWPASSQPINEYRTEGLASMCYPWLFPDGVGDPTVNDCAIENVSFLQRIQHLMKVADSLNGKPLYRFAADPTFAFWALDRFHRWTVNSQASFFVKQNPGEGNLSVGELREMSTDTLVKKITRYLGRIRGVPSYWKQRSEDLKAIIENKGSPHLFFTISWADMQNPHFHRLCGYTDEDLNSDQRRRNVCDNGHLADWLFVHFMKKFTGLWLEDICEAEYLWYRFEYQHRGTVHLHGISRFKFGPNLKGLMSTIIEGYKAELLLKESGSQETQDELRIKVENGKLAQSILCRFADWLISASNPNPPAPLGDWHPPLVHPSKKVHNPNPQVEQEDYVDLSNMVQTHSCVNGRCQRVVGGQTQCRFGFPKEIVDTTHIAFSEKKKKDGTTVHEPEIIYKRNDPNQNTKCPLQLMYARGNVDAKVTENDRATLHYVTKYITKAESSSSKLKDILRESANMANEVDDAKQVFVRTMNKVVGCADMSNQEVFHRLMSTEYYRSTHQVVAAPLVNKRRLRVLAPDQAAEEDAVEQSLLDQYAGRQRYEDEFTGISNLNYMEFVAQYAVVAGTLRKRSTHVIPRAFPSYPSDPTGANFHLYCKFQLLKYKPWLDIDSSTWGGIDEPTSQHLIESWQQFLESDIGQEKVTDHHVQLAAAERALQDMENDTEEEDGETDVVDEHRDEWMDLLNQHVEYEINHNEVEWTHDYSEQQLGEAVGWINDQKNNGNFQVPPPPEIDISTFTDEQQKAYNIVREHHVNQETLRMLIIGTAGTGKSYLINSIRNILGNQVKVTASTGKAASAISAQTIHSLLQLPVGNSKRRELRGAELKALQEKMRGISYVLIDEYSMLGCETLFWIDSRLKQSTGKMDTLTGGISVILVGDPAQLPPVGDAPLYAPNKKDESIRGHLVYMQFKTIVCLTEVMRQQGDSEARFRQLLNNIRNGVCTEEDVNVLQSRSPASLTASMGHHEFQDKFKGAPHLHSINEEVDEYNKDQLLGLGSPIAKIEARNTNGSAALSSEDMGGLENNLYLAKGAKVMITSNLWTEAGLVNGETGIVRDIVYADGHKPPMQPLFVMVQCDTYKGPSFLPDVPSCVPICPISARDDTGIKQRTQLPLKLAWSVSIHKSQGQTLDTVWVDIGKRDFAPGLAFVGLSRVKSIENLCVNFVPRKRLVKTNPSAAVTKRLMEERRLLGLAN